jgi:hypothetical protein
MASFGGRHLLAKKHGLRLWQCENMQEAVHSKFRSPIEGCPDVGACAPRVFSARVGTTATPVFRVAGIAVVMAITPVGLSSSLPPNR